ncbi:NAD(P)H-hydrate dehydratase [Pelomonas sp. V22]|uniref:NAD(P)H-hydrate dehydratase n=1 Tax=Pelomonas sp. V22 TaxID=2822139 RepID=UPI0024A9D1A4|nr:NAD(P)H-hydrate dehydratase [Pelomonas sp. V22]MDI4632326.1 NAD(P)H-hydrate dehydratase [Pelomonas sp. V22]
MLTQVLPAPLSLLLHSDAQCRALEAGEHQPPLMERAGLALAKLALALQPHARQIHVVCGPGNNGGDGLVAAQLLHAAGRQPRVSLISAGKATPPDAARALIQAREAGVPIEAGWRDEGGSELLIDALLGLGLSRAPEGEIATAIERINAQTSPVLAVDLPSGLSSETGHTPSTAWVRAHDTLSLLTLKPGLFTGQGREAAGRIWFDDLGIAAPADGCSRLTGADVMAAAPAGGHAAHKGSRGDVLVIGGAPGMQGAARLAARASLASGAGRVYLCLLGEADGGADPQRPELMQRTQAQLTDVASWRNQVVVAGCGASTAIAPLLPSLLSQAERLVLDADALNVIAADSPLQNALSERSARRQSTWLTPHPLEAARLLGCSSAEIQANRMAAIEALLKRYRCGVVLKGSGSLVASPGALPSINSSGNAALATPGSGDVLAGWLGGLWAQAPSGADLHALACRAVYWHGAAADSQAAGPLRASDLIERMHSLHPRR